MSDDDLDQLALVASEEAEQVQKVSDSLSAAAEEVKALFERAGEAFRSGEKAALQGVKESLDEFVVRLESDAASLKESYENLTEAADALDEEEEEEDEPAKPAPKKAPSKK